MDARATERSPLERTVALIRRGMKRHGRHDPAVACNATIAVIRSAAAPQRHGRRDPQHRSGRATPRSP